MRLILDSLIDTEALGRAFAACCDPGKPLPPLLMRGQLGAGKTTFVRGLVAALPGSENAEVSSPSFNILNLYPTVPEVGHFDLYRTEGLGFGPDLEEVLLDPARFCVVEWAEYLPDASLPEEFIAMTWTIDDQGRHVDLAAHGSSARALLDCVRAALPTFR
ncbi:MAG: tRNA (adenosine(37)-N6)-threonylcarbamoyltransferase complex ATPase subunit type 1 TsaE [Deltaproteobacteria bacterium]|nr:tRNA (adenosine(37)-N6)-threonylcarbamoyltransferase complex ATPase subunit type 1 TsaE [Deltaproteobacteria bacterium]